MSSLFCRNSIKRTVAVSGSYGHLVTGESSKTCDTTGGSVKARKQLPLVGKRIRELRKDHDFTQAELAARVGIQQSDLCRMETGEYKVSLETLFKILSVFEMNIAEFFQEPVPAQPGSLAGDVLELFNRLENEDQREVLDFLLFKLKQGDKHLDDKKSGDAAREPMVVGGGAPKRYPSD